jgi:hypothetical protein
MLDTLSLIGDRIIAYRPILRTLGISSTTNGTLLASQLLYLYQQAGRQPFAVTDMELAAQTGLGVREIRNARADLTKRLGDQSFFLYEVRGWRREGFYDVDVDRINAIAHKPSRGAHSTNGANGETQPGSPFDQRGECIRPDGHSHSTNQSNANDQRGESSIYKNLLEDTKKKEEDLLKGSKSTEPKPEPKPKDPFAAKKLPVEAIPSDLLDCQELLPEFWEVKKGVRSERVFNRVCANLRQWTPEARRQALESAIASKWGDVFQPKGAIGLPNGSTRRSSTTITHDSRLQVGEFLRANGLA